ncbi:wsv279 [White spot syndrome virus]|uniref:Wsv279 n=4 Tax=White spot syndrome virus TaxID=342409 RepID=Q8VAV0_WSSVS|nr:wsv279 [Shrimp white spot syndrome virus]AFX59653.1 wsv279 [White spot syndrome virus]AAL33282.1 wsv279 [Shrimp white spot syndrome virus]AAL89202.1 WSSV334 [Shrimp white spot syndrome virus]AWQ60856.1 wsv279 [Shrimp white spot syndrome virus]AWQ61273.1 wsv279 [Shrimp white spot syndrome virus]
MCPIELEHSSPVLVYSVGSNSLSGNLISCRGDASCGVVGADAVPCLNVSIHCTVMNKLLESRMIHLLFNL